MPRRPKALVLDLLKAGGLVPVIRADSADVALRVADALVAGGIRTIEITMTVPDALSAIRSVRSRFGGRLAPRRGHCDRPCNGGRGTGGRR